MTTKEKDFRILVLIFSLMIIALLSYCIIRNSYIISLEAQVQNLSELKGSYYAAQTQDFARNRKHLEDEYQDAIRRLSVASITEKICYIGFFHDIHCAKLALDSFDKAVEYKTRMQRLED